MGPTYAETRDHVNKPHVLIVHLRNILISTPCPFQIHPSLPHIQINPNMIRLNRTNILHIEMPVTLEGYVHIKKNVSNIPMGQTSSYLCMHNIRDAEWRSVTSRACRNVFGKGKSQVKIYMDLNTNGRGLLVLEME